jgi:hypothetical protein
VDEGLVEAVEGNYNGTEMKRFCGVIIQNDPEEFFQKKIDTFFLDDDRHFTAF